MTNIQTMSAALKAVGANTEFTRAKVAIVAELTAANANHTDSTPWEESEQLRHFIEWINLILNK